MSAVAKKGDREMATKKIPPEAYGTRCYPGGRIIEVTAKHQAWTDYGAKCIDAYPRLVAALRDHVAFSPNSPTSDAARALLDELGEKLS
jgi:hypothetical protein